MVAIDELLSVWEERQEQGVPITPEELCRNCPSLLDEVRWHIRALQAVDSCFGRAESNGAATETVSTELPPDPLREGPVRVTTEFRIERLHASGGLGHVFIASDQVLNRKVAVKFPKWNRMTAGQRVRFEREARITARLDHPGIVPIHALRHDDPRRPCYVMQFVEGPTLQQAIEELHAGSTAAMPARFYAGLEIRKLLNRFVSLCNIVAYAHGQRVIHRDIKPANVILGPFGETLLLDWGLAKVLGEWEAPPETEPNEETPATSVYALPESGGTRTGAAMGTPAFASPEQLLGKTADVDERSDIFSLGATLFFLLTGQYHVDLNSPSEQLVQASRGRIAAPRDRVPLVPAPLNAICHHAMAGTPDRRYASVSALTADIERYLGGEAVSVHRDAWPIRLGRWLRRRPVIAAATGATLLVAIVAASLGSLLLGAKNRELVTANSRLEQAMENSLAANQQSLLALRSAVDDVVIRDLSEGMIPDVEERRFLEQVLNQYEALAKIQGSTPASMAIRAEGLGQTGRILLRLADETAALEKLRESVRQFQLLVDETGDAKHRLQLARAKGDLSEALQRIGELDEGIREVTEAIELVASADPSPAGNSAGLAVRAQLHRILAGGQQKTAQWAAADESLTSSQAAFEQLLKHQPAESSLRQSLAAVYRMQGEVASRRGNLARQAKSLGLAIETQRELVAQFPDQPEHEHGLALALNSLSRHREFHGQITQSIDELTEAVDVCTRLARRFPRAIQYRQTLATLHQRRGNLYFLHEQPVLADRDLQQATGQWAGLAKEQPEIPDLAAAWQEAQLDLAQLKYETRRLNPAEQLLEELIASGEQFSLRFPELAKTSMVLPIARVLLTRIQIVSAGGKASYASFEEALARFSAIAGQDHSGLPEYWIAYTNIHQSSVLRSLKDVEAARVRLKMVADLLRQLEDTHPENHALLSKLAGLHREAGWHFEQSGLNAEAAFHRNRELELRLAVVKAFPENPYYRVLLARSWMGQADGALAERGDPATLDRLTMAGTVLQEAADRYPDDNLVMRTLGDLRTREGRVLFAGKFFIEAGLKFDEAVRLNPSFENRASQAHNLAWYRPDEVLGKIDGILADGIPDKFPLLTLLRACGVAATAQKDFPASEELALRAERLLRHMVDERYSPTQGSLRQLRTGSQFAGFREREVFSQLLTTLERGKLDRGSPEYIRRLPEALRPAARWLVSRNALDWNLGIWLYRALGGKE